MTGTLYDLIEVSPKASAGEIETACLQLGETYRLDKNSDSPQYKAKFKLIEDAFEILGNQQKRLRYDKALKDLGI